MIDIVMPESTIGNIRDDYEIARGPFVVVHNGSSSVGSLMAHNGNDVSFWDGTNTLTLDDTYIIDGNGTDRVRAYSDVYESSFLFRPVEIQDASWIYSDDDVRPTTLNDLLYMVRDEMYPPFAQ